MGNCNFALEARSAAKRAASSRDQVVAAVAGAKTSGTASPANTTVALAFGWEARLIETIASVPTATSREVTTVATRSVGRYLRILSLESW